MTDEQAQLIVINTDRIATAMETFLANQGFAPKPEEIDIGEAVSKAMDAIGKANPVFGAAMKQVEAQMLGGGEKS